ncbi:MazG-like family protein [Branchiibius hedensis]|uniref:MazG-like family protein n=1 Tax=Branchiibius hedensis TaxID=672460 RepID=UPI000D6A8D0D|nr:nucleotide pyrophosphohydrolase [Branchiibius hedensis]
MSDLQEIRDAVRQFIAERDWQQFQDPKSLLLALVGEVGELAELVQWLPAEEARSRIAKEPLHTRVAEEMADVLIYLVGMADQCNIDLHEAALAKVERNSRKYPVSEFLGEAPHRG